MVGSWTGPISIVICYQTSSNYPPLSKRRAVRDGQERQETMARKTLSLRELTPYHTTIKGRDIPEKGLHQQYKFRAVFIIPEATTNIHVLFFVDTNWLQLFTNLFLHFQCLRVVSCLFVCQCHYFTKGFGGARGRLLISVNLPKVEGIIFIAVTSLSSFLH